MAWRYRKSVKLFPGVRINFSKSGISTTVGIRGASINFSQRGTYLNTGIPGSGLYNRTRIDIPTVVPEQHSIQDSTPSAFLDIPSENYVIPDPNAIKSADTDSITSSGLVSLKDTLNEAFAERKEISDLIDIRKKEVVATINKLASLGGFFSRTFRKGKIQKLQALKSEKEDEIQELEEQRDLCTISLDIELDDSRRIAHLKLIDDFIALSKCEMIWDVTSSQVNEQAKSSVAFSLERRPVRLSSESIPIIKSEYSAMKFQNANGSDIYLYPGFVVITDTRAFGFLSITDVSVLHKISLFLEEEQLPKDSKKQGSTWRYVNKNGGPDKRYSDNIELPIMEYGKVSLSSKTGLNEEFLFSDNRTAATFVETWQRCQSTFNTLAPIE